MRRVSPPVFFLLCAGLVGGWIAFGSSENPQGRVLVLKVTDEYGDSHTVVVRTSSQPSYYLKTDGVQVQRYSPEEGLLIVNALEEKGILDDQVIVKTLLGTTGSTNLVPGAKADMAEGSSEGPSNYHLCLQIAPLGNIENVVRIPMRGGYKTFVLDPETGDRIRRFSIEDAVTIVRELRKDGYDWDLITKVLLGLKEGSGTITADSGVVSELADQRMIGQIRQMKDPVDPGCGECEDGEWDDIEQVCFYSTTISCTVCKVC